MNDFNTSVARGRSMDASVDQGLRSFMLGVYQKLTIGIALSGVLAFAAGTWDPLTALIFGTPLYYVVAFAPVVLIMGSMFFMKNPSPTGSAILYWAIVTCIGLSLGVYFFMAEQSMTTQTAGGITQSLNYMTITKAFLITASAFAALSLWGYTTKRDLSPIGSFAIMAIWALFAVAVVYMFLPMLGIMEPSSGMEWLISGGFALLSAVLVAWQTQELKEGYYQLAHDGRSLAVMTNWGALNFFIMFVNMFRFVLMLLASRE
ncbi:Bax inhibitor-1/YccA family protein [Henriciella aquimarina]|uniref:Bax inhibitor-1/YccA family protein n=1 Tax=Henriciella aquimarina TaxID=545261 RepID=UPI001F43EC9C|nr:Bax inhibitor-1/YccA family protein [Henriciella aquimarina]